MNRVSFRCYAQLNDFLPPDRRQVTFAVEVGERQSVKHVIEALGIPHTEVGLILADGRSVDFSYLVADGDRMSVYPPFTSVDVPSPLLRQSGSPEEPRFVLDAHLGKLAAHLRMLGFDTLYRNDYDDATLARVSNREGRILLTRDRGLLKRRLVNRGSYVWETDPEAQLVEVVRRFDLLGAIRPFRRCVHCNGVLAPVPKEAIEDRLQPKTRLYYDEFRICPDCDQVYWKGSHYHHLEQFIRGLGARCAVVRAPHLAHHTASARSAALTATKTSKGRR